MGRTFWFDDWWPVEALAALGLVVLIAAVIGLLRTRAGARRGRRRSARSLLKRASLSFLALLGFLTVIASVVFLFQFGSYHILTEWEVVARVACGKRGALQQFDLQYSTLARGKDRTSRHYEVYGNRWALRADFVQWKGLLRRLGYDRSFKITRLSGAYDREQDYLERPVTSLTLGRGSDRFWIRSHKGGIPWIYRPFIEAVYTSSVSHEPTPGDVYDVVGTKDGLGLRKVDY